MVNPDFDSECLGLDEGGFIRFLFTPEAFFFVGLILSLKIIISSPLSSSLWSFSSELSKPAMLKSFLGDPSLSGVSVLLFPSSCFF